MRAFAIVVCSLLAICTMAQFNVYRTIDDLVNGTPIEYPSFKYHSQKGQKNVIITIQDPTNKERVNIDCSQIWGFSFQDALYRIVRHGPYYTEGPENFPVRLYVVNEVHYWVHGYWLEYTVMKHTPYEMPIKGPFTGFVSVEVDSELLLARHETWQRRYTPIERDRDRFFRENPDLEWLRNCVKVRESRGFAHTFALHCIEQRRPQGNEVDE